MLATGGAMMLRSFGAAPRIVGKPTVLLGDMPVRTHDSKLICSSGGEVQLTLPGQLTVQT